MKIQPVCISCLFGQAEKLLQEKKLPPREELAILKEIAGVVHRLDADAPPPVYGREVHLMIQGLLKEEDPYFPQKKMSNDNALSLLPRLKKELKEAQDPLYRAVQTAISGNIIDYGAPGSGTMDSIEESLSQALSLPLDTKTYELFRKETAAAKNILYIGDNAGEIVFDRLLIDELMIEKVTFAVRGEIILNDATRDDLRYTKLFNDIRVIDTGDSTPGIDMDRSSKTFIDAVSAADMVILKGQGNFETLYGGDTSSFTGGNTPFYYLFKAKCAPVAKMTGVDMGNIAFLRTCQ